MHATRGAQAGERFVTVTVLYFRFQAKASKVSLSRFARIIDLIRDGRDCPSGVPSTAVCLAFLWATATTTDEVLTFYEAATQHLPPGSLLSDKCYPAGPHQSSASDQQQQQQQQRQEWLSSSFARDAALDFSPMAIATAKSLVSAAVSNVRPC